MHCTWTTIIGSADESIIFGNFRQIENSTINQFIISFTKHLKFWQWILFEWSMANQTKPAFTLSEQNEKNNCYSRKLKNWKFRWLMWVENKNTWIDNFEKYRRNWLWSLQENKQKETILCLPFSKLCNQRIVLSFFLILFWKNSNSFIIFSYEKYSKSTFFVLLYQ